MNPSSFGDAVGGGHDLAVERCVDVSAPGVAVACPDPEDEPAKEPSGVVSQAASLIHLEQVEREALPQHVGAVAWYAVAGCIDRYPAFTAQRKVHDDGSIELTGHGLMLGPRRSMTVNTDPSEIAEPVTSLGDPHGTR
jgi:hypothetical protein